MEVMNVTTPIATNARSTANSFWTNFLKTTWSAQGTVYIRTVSSEHLLSALLIWSKPVLENQHVLYTRFLPRQARKESNVPKLENS
jgi:hypothetical protein